MPFRLKGNAVFLNGVRICTLVHCGHDGYAREAVGLLKAQIESDSRGEAYAMGYKDGENNEKRLQKTRGAEG